MEQYISEPPESRLLKAKGTQRQPFHRLRRKQSAWKNQPDHGKIGTMDASPSREKLCVVLQFFYPNRSMLAEANCCKDYHIPADTATQEAAQNHAPAKPLLKFYDPRQTKPVLHRELHSNRNSQIFSEPHTFHNPYSCSATMQNRDRNQQ